MAPGTSNCCFFSFLSLLAICSGRYTMDESAYKELKWDEGIKFSKLDRKAIHDFINAPTTILPTSPDSSTPTIITVPATNPVTVTPSSPTATPVSLPLTTPISVPATNPANTPVPFTDPVAPTVTIPGAQPITNPVTTYPAPTGGVPVATPVTNPVPVAPPAIPGQSWCVVRSGASETAVQSALDYACGTGVADCSQIQQGGSCYNPNTLENHASFAFNSYFQRNPAPTSCDFGGTAMITNSNPSSGSCIYPLSSSPSATPSSLTPSVPTPTPMTPIPIPPTTVPTPTTSTPAGIGMPENGSPPTVFNTGNPASSIGGTTGFGSEIPPSSTTSMAMAAGLRPFTFCITVMTSLMTRQIFLDW